MTFVHDDEIETPSRQHLDPRIYELVVDDGHLRVLKIFQGIVQDRVGFFQLLLFFRRTFLFFLLGDLPEGVLPLRECNTFENDDTRVGCL